MLIVEKTTNYQYSNFWGTFKNLPKKKQNQLLDNHNAHNESKNMLLAYCTINNIDYNLVRADSLSSMYLTNNELVVALGGDGTFLKAAEYISDQYILGINSDPKSSVGALANFNKDNFKKTLDSYFTNPNSLSYDSWSRLAVTINAQPIRHRALNEILIGNTSILNTSHLEVSVNGYSGFVVGNGILASTNKGSTAFYKSAGGEPFKEDKIGLVHLLPFKEDINFNFPKLVDENLDLTIIPKRQHYSISFDSSKSRIISLDQGDVVKVYLDKENPLKVLK